MPLFSHAALILGSAARRIATDGLSMCNNLWAEGQRAKGIQRAKLCRGRVLIADSAMNCRAALGSEAHKARGLAARGTQQAGFILFVTAQGLM